jgi:hypothetical protein
MDIFVSRIPKDQPYHGGVGPDAVDFRVYSWIMRYIHTFTMKNLMLARGPNDKLNEWYDRMDRACKNKTHI